MQEEQDEVYYCLTMYCCTRWQSKAAPFKSLIVDNKKQSVKAVCEMEGKEELCLTEEQFDILDQIVVLFDTLAQV